MKRRFLYGGAVLLMSILVGITVWLGSFSFDWFSPASAEQTILVWAVSILVFLLTVTLGFMLVRTFVRLWAERRVSREGSRIRTKLVAGALALSMVPLIFLVVFSIYVLNNTLKKWFSRPMDTVVQNLVDANLAFEGETQKRAVAQVQWLALRPDVAAYARTAARPATLTATWCRQNGVSEAWIEPPAGALPLPLCAAAPETGAPVKAFTARAPVDKAEVVVRARMAADLAEWQQAIEREVQNYQKLNLNQKEVRNVYIQLLLLISLFILFVATWIALQLSKQISIPIAALVEAAGQLRRGNLDYRIDQPAPDELGTLVRAFNEMAADLQANEKELDRRRNFTEAILESIPTGVISLSAERRIQRVNSALAQMMGAARVAGATQLEDLFPAEDARDVHYLLNRARRTGLASAQIDVPAERHTLHLAVTVSALVGRHTSGWVVVLEDTSEVLRAQKALAWHEVARRIAHEIKNPLTPIALSAERIARQIGKADSGALTPEMLRIIRQCSLTISGEVESVKTLVDEFSQFARFPAAQPQPSDLNEAVEGALSVFAGRLEGVAIRTSLAPGLPAVSIDREQFKRVVVNLVDNAAEAMQDSPLRELDIRTQMAGADSVELIIADTGHGISTEDRERLFLPYFSTKNRGTGLGLAIVHHILQEHGAQIRVEDNQPNGARFVVEVPAPADSESRPETKGTEARPAEASPMEAPA